MIIYKTTNLINNRFYVGQDRKNNPKYLGSGKILKLAIAKYGRKNFKKEILEHCNNLEHLNEQEIYWIKKLNARERNIGYNISSGGIFGDTLSKNPNLKEIGEKISKRNKGKKRSAETKRRLSLASKGHATSKETRIKMSIGAKNRAPASKDTRNKLKIILKERCRGRNNIMVKPLKIISPLNIEYIERDGLRNFCRINDLNYTRLFAYKNKGKIPMPAKNHMTIANIKTVGWAVYDIED